MNKNDGLLQAGKIVNTHGIHGEVKIEPWADSPDFLLSVGSFYIGGEIINTISSRSHKGYLFVSFKGVDNIDAAIKLKGKILSIKRADVILEEGRHFIADLIGLKATHAGTGDEIGIITDILQRPASNIYVIQPCKDSDDTKNRGGKAKEILIPAISEFVEEIDIKGGFIKFRPIEGML